MTGKDLLAVARQALLKGLPEDAHDALRKFHAENDPAMDDDPATTRRILKELEQMATAGQAGVATARRDLAGAIDIAAGVSTYDKQGQRNRANANSRKPMRF